MSNYSYIITLEVQISDWIQYRFENCGELLNRIHLFTEIHFIVVCFNVMIWVTFPVIAVSNVQSKVHAILWYLEKLICRYSEIWFILKFHS